MKVLEHVLAYAIQTKKKGLVFDHTAHAGRFDLAAFSDADFASDERGMVGLDVERGRVAIARVRTGVSTRHRRLEERRVGRRKRETSNVVFRECLNFFSISLARLDAPAFSPLPRAPRAPTSKFRFLYNKGVVHDDGTITSFYN